MANEDNTIDDLYQAYADATASGDNAKRSVISKLIQSEEQGLAGSEASNIAAAEGRGIEGTEAAGKYIKDFGKVLSQLAIETGGGINRLLPRNDPSGEPSDYYGLIDAPASVFGHAIKSKLGFDTNQEELSGMTIPVNEYINNPRFAEHMMELQDYGRYKLAENISPELGEAARKADMTGDESELIRIFEELSTEAMMNDDAELGMKLESLKNGTGWQIAYREGDNIIINKLPQVDEGPFGFDMTLDPYWSESSDLVLPGEGVFGMRDGKLEQLASAIGRPLDEMLMYNMPGGEWASENITDKLAFQGPELLQPKDAGMGYSHGMMAALVRGVGWPAAKGIFKAGKAGYNLAKRQPNTNINRVEPFIAEGILSNIK